MRDRPNHMKWHSKIEIPAMTSVHYFTVINNGSADNIFYFIKYRVGNIVEVFLMSIE